MLLKVISLGKTRATLCSERDAKGIAPRRFLGERGVREILTGASRRIDQVAVGKARRFVGSHGEPLTLKSRRRCRCKKHSMGRIGQHAYTIPVAR
jgi:hypothetical protein